MESCKKTKRQFPRAVCLDIALGRRQIVLQYKHSLCALTARSALANAKGSSSPSLQCLREG